MNFNKTIVQSYWGCIHSVLRPSTAEWCLYNVFIRSMHVNFLMTLLSVPYTQRISSRLFSDCFPDDCHNLHAACHQTCPPRYWCFYKAPFISFPSLLCLCLWNVLLNETIYVPDFIHVAKWCSAGLHHAILFSKDLLSNTCQSFVIWGVGLSTLAHPKKLIISPINIHKYYLCRSSIHDHVINE